ESGRACSDLTERAGAGNDITYRHDIAAVEGERGVISDAVGTERSGRSTITNLQGSGTNRRRATVAVGPGKDCCARSNLAQGPSSRDCVTDRHAIATIEGE